MLYKIAFTFSLLNLIFPQASIADDFATKKSKNGYCHYKTSIYYAKTKTYESYNTLSACLASGGSIPPGPSDKQNSQPNVKFSKSGICHDSTSEWFFKNRNYVEMQSMKECLTQGGREPLNN